MAKNLRGFACLVILFTDWDPMANDHPFAPPFGIICLELFPYCQTCKTKTVITFLTGNAWRREVPPLAPFFVGRLGHTSILLLMEEILHHLGCKQICKYPP